MSRFSIKSRPITWIGLALIAVPIAVAAGPSHAQPFPPQAQRLPAIAASNAYSESLAPWVSDAQVHPAAFADVSQSATDPMIEALSKRVAELEAQAKKHDEAEKKRAEKEKQAAANEPPLDKWNVKMGGHVQLDLINWANAAPSIPDAKDYFEFRRLRLVADGAGYGMFDFRLQFTLEPETVGETQPLGTVASPDVKDAYLSMNDIPWLGRFRIGNFFVPFSLEQVTNDTNTSFLERSIPSQGVYAVDREVGVALYNCTENQRLTWTCGAFIDNITDALKERIDDEQGFRLSGRVTCLPYYDEASEGRFLVHLGAGVLYTDDQNDVVQFRARPQIHEGPRIIDSGPIFAGQYTNGNLEFAAVCGPVTVQSEAFLSQADRNVGGPVTTGGAYVLLSYFLTGENRIFDKFGQHGAQFARNKPYENFFITPHGCGRGAWELKARWSNLTLTDVDRGEYNDLTAGVNWYWNDRTRVMFEWIHPVTSSAAIFGATKSDILGLRFDWNW